MLKNGQTVAIKIQHPDVKKNAYTDMNTVDVRLYLYIMCSISLFLIN